MTPAALRELLRARGGAEGLDLSNAVLVGNFENWDLSGIILRRAVLVRAYLRGVNLEGANLYLADLSRVNLSESNLKHAVLELADLPGANLWNAHLEFTDLSGANLMGAAVDSAFLHRANLAGANFSAADLSDSDMTHAILRNCNLHGANLEKADLSNAHLEHSDLFSANLEGCILRDTDLRDCNLQAANLEAVDLTGADLSIANLTGANLERSNLLRVKLEGTNLHGVGWGPVSELAIDSQDPETAEAIYRSLKIWHQGAGFHDAAGRYFYREMDARRIGQWRSGSKAHAVWLWFLKSLAGYGEQPGWVVLWVVALVVVPGFIYRYAGAFEGRDLLYSLYYSAVSTAALGYGQWVNADPVRWAQLAGVAQTLFGVLLIALFLVTFTRKMTR